MVDERGSGEQKGCRLTIPMWPAAVMGFLDENPWCARCKRRGVVRLADLVDGRYGEYSKWEALCRNCHYLKLIKESEEGMPRKAKEHKAEPTLPKWWPAAMSGFLDEHPWCVHCHDRGESTAAAVVDHMIPHKGDTKFFRDTSNWQALCEFDRGRKAVREVAGGKVVVVHGESASGKSTYVRVNKKSGDLVWDYDSVARSITGCSGKRDAFGVHDSPKPAIPMLQGMRSAFVEAVRSYGWAGNVWIILTSQTTAKRVAERLNGSLVLVDRFRRKK